MFNIWCGEYEKGYDGIWGLLLFCIVDCLDWLIDLNKFCILIYLYFFGIDWFEKDVIG